MNKIIKLKTFQEKAVFRTPYSMEIIETYPLPPYSTIIGFVHNMLSFKRTRKGINVSIQGKYGNLNREFIRYHKYGKGEIEGIPYPIVVTTLIELELIIHIKMPTAELHKKLLFSLSDPPHFPYLGRPEDLISEMKVDEDEEKEIDLSKTTEGSLTLPYNCYIPFVLAKELEVEGTPYFIPAYYEIIENPKSSKKKFQEMFRNFEMIKVIYAQAEQTITKKIKIDNEGIPIWWMKY